MRETIGNSIHTREQEREMAAKQTAQVAHGLNECGPVSDPNCGSYRQSARAVLEQRYEALLREANGIHALLQALPGSMGREAEEALWQIVVARR